MLRTAAFFASHIFECLAMLKIVFFELFVALMIVLFGLFPTGVMRALAFLQRLRNVVAKLTLRIACVLKAPSTSE